MIAALLIGVGSGLMATPAKSYAAAGSPRADLCEIRLVARVPTPPTEHLGQALEAWRANIDDHGALQLALSAAGARLVPRILPLRDGAALVITIQGPQAAQRGIRLTADLVAAAFQPARFSLDSPDTDGANGLADVDLGPPRAAIAATQRAVPADSDAEMAAARLLLLLEGANLERVETCGPSAGAPATLVDPAALLPTAEPLVLRASDTRHTTLPRLFLVAPLPKADPSRADPTPTLLAYLNHPGSTHHRALVSPNVRGIAARATVFETSGLLVITVDLDPRADWRDSLREATRALQFTRAEASELAGAAALAAAEPGGETQAAQSLARSLTADNVTWVFIPGSAQVEGTVPITTDQEGRSRYVAASVELTCPAPGDARPADVRLEDKLGIDADAWRSLAREVAGDRDALAALTREAEDRCGELARLRKLVNLDTFTKFYKEHLCRISAIADADLAWREQRALLQGLGLDSALYRPILDMIAGDLRLEAIATATRASCPPPRAPKDAR